MIGPPSGEVVSGAILAAERHGLPYERYTKKELEKNYPWFTLDDSQEAVFEPDAGYLFSEVAVKAHVHQAVRFGAEIRLGCQVREWSQSGDGIEVRLPGETIYTEQLLLTVGAFAPQFVYKDSLQVERQVLHWFETDDEAAKHLPIYIVEEPSGSTFYGFPNSPGQGLKVAIHHDGEICTADTIDREVHPRDIERMRRTLSPRIPSIASGKLVKSLACMHTNTPDFHFIVGPHSDQKNVMLGLGYSGHGFKFSSAMGEMLVDLLQGKSSTPVPEIFASGRFANSRAKFVSGCQVILAA